MPLINWDVSLSVGVKEIDAQHQKLIELLNELFDVMHSDEAKNKMNEIVGRLNDYVIFHFTNEENYFEKFNYKNKDVHIKQHETYKEKIIEFNKMATENNTMLPYEVLDFLENWILGHISTEDKKYTKCFKENGLN